MTAIRDIADLVAGTRLRDLPTDVVERGTVILADCIGCMAAGGREPEVLRLVANAKDQGKPTATVIGTVTRLEPQAAAYVNGTSGTWHDLDEGNLSCKTHAAIQLVPAALAEAESRGLSGERLLEASILAYEAAARLWRATDVRYAVHPHGTYGPLAAAFALSKLRGEKPAAMAEAAGIAMTLGIASSRKTLADGALVRNVYTGMSGRNGYEALVLRDAGFSGEADPASSILGNIYGSAFDAKKATAGLGRTWWIRRNYYKRFPSGRYTHGPMDLVEELIARHGGKLKAEKIARLDIKTYFFAATLAHQSVRTTFGVRFSIPILLARRIVHGPVALTDDGTRAFKDKAVHKLAERIFVTEDKALTARYPEEQPTRMTVKLADGTVEKLSSDRILGEADNPYPSGILEAKFIELAGRTLGDGAPKAWADVMSIREVGDVSRLTQRWRRFAASE